MTAERPGQIPDDQLRQRLGRLTKRSILDWLMEQARTDGALREALTRFALPARPPASGRAADGGPGRIARRLLEAGRPSDALYHLDRWQESDPHAIALAEVVELRSEALLALGRPSEAFDVLWTAFRRTLRAGFLRSAVTVAPRARAAHLEAEAMDAAENHPDADLALGFLIAHGALDRAAALIERRFDELSAGDRTGLQPVAAALREDDPRQAWQLLRLTLIDALEDGDADTCAQAAGCLQQMQQLADGCGFAQEHGAFVEQLRHDYQDRKRFWSTVPGE